MTRERSILSISLLSSGRIESIERCLASLDDIRKAVPTEVVIVDTDPDKREDVRVILEKYADEIIRFDWCDDFAAARNAGLSRCSGKWFMFIDDDEWFIDSRQITDFFLSGEYKEYGSADFKVRNYLDEGKTRFNDSWVGRMVKLDSDTCFKGRVHESIYGSKGRVKALDAVVGHEGYIFTTEEQKREHSKRNISLLEISIKEEPDNVHWLYQLYLEYDSIEDRDGQNKLCNRAIDLLKNKRDSRSAAFYGFFVCGLLRLYRLEGRWDEVIKLYDKWYNKELFGIVSDAYIFMELALAHHEIGNNKLSKNFCDSYLKTYEKWHNRADELRNEALFFLEGTFTQPIYGVVISILNDIDIGSGSYESFDKYFKTLSWSDDAPYDMSGVAGNYIKILEKYPYDAHFIDIVKAFSTSGRMRSLLKYHYDNADDKGKSNIARAIDGLEGKQVEKMDLTISLLSSGRINTIERCLSSLMIFKEQLDTEILIVDTDPEKRQDVREILEKYADRIISFEWCDDFAAARNAGLKEAKGDWFMFVDDDEWFIEAQPIIDFLKSNEKDKYYWTDFRTRNYTTKDFSLYTDAWATRLVKRTKNLKFIGRVHEYFDPLPGKPKVLEAMEGHTGYIYENEEAKKAHDRRNISLLERLIEEEPNEPRWWLQLLQEYEDTADYEKKKTFCKECLSKLKKKEGEGFNRSRSLFAANLIRLERQRKDWKAATEAYKKAVKEKRYNDVGKTYMELDAAQAYFYIDDLKEAEIHCRAYLRYYNKLHNKQELIHEDTMFFMEETFYPHMWGLAVNLLMYIEMSDGRFEAFDKYFDKAEWSDEMLYEFRGYEGKFLEIIEKGPYNDRFSHMLEVFWKGSVSRGVVQDRLGELLKERGEEYWNLVGALMKSELSEPKPYDLKILWADHTDESGDYDKWYKALVEKINPFFLDVSLWQIANKNNVGLAAMIDELPFMKWRRYVDYFIEHAPMATQRDIFAEYDKQASKESFHRFYYSFRAKGMMIAEDAAQWEASVVRSDNGVMEISDPAEYEAYDNALKELKDFAVNALGYYKGIYKEEVLQSDLELMDDECRIALRIDTILNQIRENDYKAALTTIKEALGVCPEMDEALTAFSHLYSSIITKKVASPQSEMQQLVDSLYKKVDELVSQGFVNEARDIIAQIEAIAPPELRRQ